MPNLPDRPDDRQLMRASDADRERIADILRASAGEGRLSLSELDERLAWVYEARTYADLEPLVSDLPVAEMSRRSVERRYDTAAEAGAPKWLVAFMSGVNRKGEWLLGRVLNFVAVMGGGKFDLRRARVPAGEATIRVFALMGGCEIIVPEESEVHVDGFAIMGGFSQHTGGIGPVGRGPRIRVTGFALMGGVEVKRKPSLKRSGDRDDD
ncbi:hypothetical protein Afil01_68000 [Actinorhabdospora filicis]|uniref:Cell wall-active antibiotics response LiaF-like C-terminal domain-containing protein n=1 Tax=Actinorhabdospora filicis TaxID=1785913 RepID=A0A9W6STD6_9ACTN|nr:DUF1707 domain-containing protein [Actinorhabdospora filicis]GLZ81993.1 hypothetical protein Afil01_68000 [Actinorhabdospora filicis]